MDFDTVFSNMLQLEGRYANRPLEEVNMGVTQDSWDAYAKEKNIPKSSVKDLKVSAVKSFLKEKYWDTPGISGLHEEVAPFVYDYAVNSGQENSIRTIQGIVGSKADGIIGPKTIAAVNAYVEKHGADVLKNEFKNARVEHYTELAQGDPKKYGSFYEGWLNRLERLDGQYTKKQAQGVEKKTTRGDLSKHFTKAEFNQRNAPLKENEYDINPELVNRLEILRKLIGDKPIKITSGYRNKSYNKSVGGAENSQHLYGNAADIMVEGMTSKELESFAQKAGFKYTQTYKGKPHLHVDIIERKKKK
jgi:lysozyme family protein